jgi:hypothetical protein
MTTLREMMTLDLQLCGLSERTQEAYLRAVRQLADYYHTPPDRLTEEQLRNYFLLCQIRCERQSTLGRSAGSH